MRNFDKECVNLAAIPDLPYTRRVMPLATNLSGARIGTYGVITGAPVYVAVCARASEMALAGVEGERLVLQLTAMGYATCWLGATFDRKLAEAALPRDLADDESIIAVIAIGKPAAKKGIISKVMRFAASSDKRKPLTDIVIGGIPETLLPAMEAARLAPSAMNSQPWRYAFSEGASTRIDVFCVDKGRFSVLDTGISIAHFTAIAPQFRIIPNELSHQGLIPVMSLVAGEG